MGSFGSGGGGGGGAGFGAIGASSGGTSDGGFGGTGGGSDSGVDTAGGGGGGGAGLGGAVFVRSGGTFTIRDSDIDATNDATGGQGGATGTGGTAGADGQGVGGALFIKSGVTASYEVTGAGSQTVAGDIGGGGAIKKTGTGSLTLSAANSYAGGTTISDGRVVMQNTAALGTGGVTFDNMGVGAADPRLVFGVVGVDLAAGVTLTTNGKIDSNGFDGKVSSVIGGAGDLTKTGDGTLTLEADNTFTGATQIADGTLELASGASLHRDTTLDISMGATFDLTDNTQTVSQLSGAGRLDLGTGELTVDQSTNTTFSGPVTGAGGLTKTGSGSLKLSNAGNDFSGGTTIADGTLSLANAGALGTGGVTFDAAGPGADPVLQAMSDMTLAAGVDLTTDRTFDNLGFDVDFSGMVTGIGGLTKTGSGVLTFSGTASHTGGTEVMEGTLRVTGDHRSAVRVMAGTRLEGSGMVGETRITGGTLAPGGRFGVLTVKGDLTFDPGSSYEVEVDPGGATDRTDVRGKADLSGATVVVLAENGAYTPDTTYQILTAGDPITTQFDGVTSNLAFLDPSLVHESNQVLLTLTRNDVPIGGGGGGDDGDGGGGVGVGGALDRAMPAPGSDGEDVLFAILGLSVAEVPGALQSLGGVTLGSIGAITWSDAARFADVVADRLSGIGFTAGAPTSLASNNPTEAPQLAFGGGDLADLATGLSQTGPLGLSAGREEDLGLWAAGYGSFGDQEGDRRAPDYDYWVSGVALGLDHALDAGTTVGLAVGFAEGEISHDNGDDQSLEGIQAAFYGGHRVPLGFGELAIDASAGGAYTSYDSERALRFGGLDRKATGDTEAWSYWGNLALRYETTVAEGLALSPEASLRALRTEVDGFSETGAGAANLIVSDFESESLRGRLGGRLRSSHRTSGGWRIIPEARAFVSHEFADDHLTLDLRLEGLGGGFTSRTSDVARTSGVFGLTLTAEDGQDLAIFLDYEGEASQDRSVHSLYGGVKLFW
jgi:outer membrane autotransporter protein